MSITVLFAYLDIVLWLYLLAAHGIFWRTDKTDRSMSPRPASWPEVGIIIPARNEAEMLPETLPTLLLNDYPATLNIVVVDDRSEDATGAVAARIADLTNSNSQLNIIISEACTGWKGKVGAMQCGLQQLLSASNVPRYVLFTDADIAFAAGAISQLVAEAEFHNLVLASLMVNLRCESKAERWLIPAFVYFFKLLYPFHKVNDDRSKVAAAAGGCMLVRTDALLAAGGLEPIKTALIDDCALGRIMKRQGRISLKLTQNVRSLRAYPRTGNIREMVARSAYDQLGYSKLNLVGALLGMVLAFIMPALLTLFATGTTRALGAASWVIMSATYIPMVRFYKRPLIFCTTLPAIAVLYIGFTLDSAYQYMRGHGGFWKGRVQAGAQST